MIPLQKDWTVLDNYRTLLANRVDMPVSSSHWPTRHFVDHGSHGNVLDEMEQGMR